ncbi:GNAT family N-acetyltransferase [Aquamicrobium sp. LC103]|uniref:GNAT family N-acetyltransferase n=1 Tax=Aquamicrobium sp. LC103 TaxID=1120658 RepID=UPI00063EC2C7|nr:GNAT family N-acetyltransferase [Aquamicrobium sp. LC103]TKT75370.1 GNAT family N-acetyltransferase [Aquamicrobium sp. LC103]
MSTPAYWPGLVGDIVRLHADYYARNWGFGLAFEAKVAAELGQFLSGFRAGHDYFAAEADADGALLGTISLEAPRADEPLAHLRWYITSEGARGTGLGRRLLQQAIEHADSLSFPGIYLTTFDGLGAARHLYEKHGFSLVSESATDQWSGGVREQRFERARSKKVIQ